jgi:WD40 repeat protein
MTRAGLWTERAMAVVLALTAALGPGVATRADERPKIEVVPRIPHGGVVTSAAFSPDGARVATGSTDATIKLWDVATGRLIRTLARHSNEVAYSVAAVFSPDGTRVLSGSSDGMRLWDAASGRLIRAVPTSSSVKLLAFSPDGRRVLAGLLDHRAELWDATAWQRLQTFQHSDDRSDLEALAFSPDGALVLTGGQGPVAKLWDATTGKLVREFRRSKGEGRIVAHAFSPDGARVAMAVSVSPPQRSLELWDVATGKLIHTLPARGAEHMAFSQNGTLVVGTPDGLNVADFEKGQLAPIIERLSPIGEPPWRVVALSTDGTYVLSGGPMLTILDVKTKREVHLQDPSYVLRLKSLAVSPDGAHVLTGGLASTHILNGFDQHQVVEPGHNAISWWDAATGRLIRTSRLTPGEEVAALAFSPEGVMAVSSSPSSLTLWSTSTGKRIRSIYVGGGALVPRIPIGLSADGSHLVTASGNKVLLWDSATATTPRSFEGDARPVFSVAISPDGTQVAAGSEDGKVRIWDAGTGDLLRTFDVAWAEQLHRYIIGWDNPITALAFSPDGMRLAAARHGYNDDLKRMRLWNVASGHLVQTFDFQPGRIGSVAISPDGMRLLSGGEPLFITEADRPFKLWDAGSGRLIHSFDGPSGGGSAVAFSRGGQRVFSASYDGTVRAWDTETGALLATLLTAANDGWLAVTTEGFFDASTEAVATELLSIVRGLEVSPITASMYKVLHRPDLVRAKLAGDPGGELKAATAEVDAKLGVK